MNELNKYKHYLLLIGILAFAKFIMLPFFDWQQEQIDKQHLQIKRLSKLEALLENKDVLKESRDTLLNKVAKMQEGFYLFETEAVFTLEQQQAIEKLFSDNNVTIGNLGWLSKIESESSKVVTFPLQIEFAAEMSDFIELAWAIEQQNAGRLIRDISIDVKGQEGENLGYARGRITIAFYAWKGKSNA